MSLFFGMLVLANTPRPIEMPFCLARRTSVRAEFAVDVTILMLVCMKDEDDEI